MTLTRVACREQGETPDEVAGLAKAMLQVAVPVHIGEDGERLKSTNQNEGLGDAAGGGARAHGRGRWALVTDERTDMSSRREGIGVHEALPAILAAWQQLGTTTHAALAASQVSARTHLRPNTHVSVLLSAHHSGCPKQPGRVQ